MKILEFRILVPISYEQFQIAKGYTTLQMIKNMSGDGEGIEIVKNEEPFENEKEKGVITQKIYHVKSKIPSFVRWAVPDKYLHFYETSYNCFPHTTTIDSVPALGDDFILKVESYHLPIDTKKDSNETNQFSIPDNALNLNDDELKSRKIVYIDILNGPGSKSSNSVPSYTDENENTSSENMKEGDLNIRNFVCPEIGLTKPLGEVDQTKTYNPDDIPAWAKKYNGPMMLIVKVVHFHLKWFGIQTAVENLVANTFYPKLFTDTHRKFLLSANEWKSLTRDDITKLEIQIKEEQHKNGENAFTVDN